MTAIDQGRPDTRDADGDVSPMAAQNSGPAKRGPADAAPREDAPGESSTAHESPDTPIRPGGEATRDDL